MNNEKNEKINTTTTGDCFECRLATGFGVIGIGAYLFIQSNKHHKSNLLNTISLRILGGVAMGIGLTRLLNIYPFDSKSKRNA